jgi:hypothetical protein
MHDPEKWKPVSRLREPWHGLIVWTDASAGVGRSDKIMHLSIGARPDAKPVSTFAGRAPRAATLH